LTPNLGMRADARGQDVGETAGCLPRAAHAPCKANLFPGLGSSTSSSSPLTVDQQGAGRLRSGFLSLPRRSVLLSAPPSGGFLFLGQDQRKKANTARETREFRENRMGWLSARVVLLTVFFFRLVREFRGLFFPLLSFAAWRLRVRLRNEEKRPHAEARSRKERILKKEY
jgi:hypothetical protein